MFPGPVPEVATSPHISYLREGVDPNDRVLECVLECCLADPVALTAFVAGCGVAVEELL